LGCAAEDGGPPDESGIAAIERPSVVEHALSPAEQHGRDVWFQQTFGGEKFFFFLANHPDPAKRIRIAFDEMVKTPRAARFATWGVINDPDCVANPQGGADLCADPEATGVVGIRKRPGPGGATLYGVACAGCHAGFDPLDPPADPAEPTWDNIHPTVGNQYAKFGKIFAANLGPSDVRRLMFAAWPDGAVDTTALFNDNIMNPGVVTAFWDQRHRKTFDVGMADEQLRNGQGGEDDVGGDLAAVRVYMNIGVCFAECVAPRPDRPDPGAPIDLDQCRRDCADYPPQSDLDDMGAFLRSVRSPQYPERPRRVLRYVAGAIAFQASCSGCHVTQGEGRRVYSDDEVNPLDAQATNSCRARTTNWDRGKLWAAFSSEVYKNRGYKGYRTMPLTGIWATAPFMHNQSIGPWADAEASPQERVASYEAAMAELLSDTRTPKIFTLPMAVGPFPMGTPLTLVFSRDPATGQVLCDDAVENRGHTFGADLPGFWKDALIYWLRFQ
jgi:hypothetical protein